MHRLVEKDTRCGICVKKMCIYIYIYIARERANPHPLFSPSGGIKINTSEVKKKKTGTQLVTPPQLPLRLRIPSSTFYACSRVSGPTARQCSRHAVRSNYFYSHVSPRARQSLVACWVYASLLKGSMKGSALAGGSRKSVTS